MSFALLHPKGVGSFRTCRGLARRIGAGCVGGLVVLVMGPIALASDKVPTPSAQAKTSAAPVRAASPAGAESKATEPAGAQDPMDRLQQRLAERLGSRMARSEETPDGELKVVARPASGEAVKPQAMRGTAFKTGKIPGLADAFVAPVWA